MESEIIILMVDLCHFQCEFILDFKCVTNNSCLIANHKKNFNSCN